MSTALAAAPFATAPERPIRVMIVDDSIVVRRLLSRWIAAERDMAVAASACTGREAVSLLDDCRPDVVVLDIDMPELDGISALPQLLKRKRDLVVIMASTLTRRSAEISLRALSLGAADYVPKPEASQDAATAAAFQRELIDKIRHLGRRGRSLLGRGTTGAVQHLPAARRRPKDQRSDNTFKLRPFAMSPPRAILIGASTGGPQTLTTLIRQIGPAIEHVPMLITQHMPPTFTTVLAEHLARVCGRRVREAEQDEPVIAGNIYIAPGGRHMRVATSHNGAAVVLGDDPPINFCRPSVDPLLSSAAQVWGAGSLALILTGMGSDGTCGAADIAAAGGSIIAQDEATSVVWGMPRSVAQAGLCSAVLPLPEIAPELSRLLSGGRA
jgi:two-component system, chemotaxis family, protein-glutamate methylesterase/glutaminase